MPAATAGRALLRTRGRADFPYSDDATRRGFVLGSSALLASLLLPARPAATAAAAQARRSTTPPIGRSRIACRTTLDPHWDGERVHAQARDAQREHPAHPRRRRARRPHRPGAARRPRRALVTAFCNGPGVGHEAADGSQGHKPGWRGLA